MNKDYIMRIIEQFIHALLAIVTARKDGNYEEAYYQIQNASQRYLNADIAFLLSKNPDELLEYFTVGSYFDTEQSVICADLIYEIALICEAKQHENAAIPAKTLCLHLYSHALAKEKQLQTEFYEERVKDLIKDLGQES